MNIKNILQEFALTIAIIITIIVTAALNFINYIPKDEVVNCLLLADAGLATSILYSSLKYKKDIDAIIGQLRRQGSSKIVTRKEHYRLLDRAVNTAESQICIMTIDRALNQKAIGTIPERERYYNDIRRIARERREITIRRIYGLPDEEAAREDKIRWINDELKKIKNCPNYQIRIFDWRKFGNIPTPLSLQIVDDTFVGLVNMQRASTGVVGSGEDICIEDPQIVQHLKIYYDTIWDKCDELKLGDSVISNNLS